MNTLPQELSALHDAYVVAVNQAVAADDLRLVDELADAFDEDARALLAAHAPTAA
jgi:hypothetical protein